MKHYAMSAIAVLFILVYSCSNPTNSNRGDNANKTDVVMRDSVWSNTDVPYYIKSILSIEGDVHWDKKVTVILDSNAFIEVRYGGKLTIEEGVRVIFSDKSYILVGAPYGGNIDIFGTDSLPVVLTHSQNGTYWGYESFNDFGGGIMLFGVSDTAHFNHCKFEYATNGIYANKSKLSITNCTFSNMTKSGIYCTQECQLGDSNSFRGNRFEKNKGAPIVIPANVIRCLSEDNAFTDNTTQSITVTGGMVSRSGTWKNLSYPYCFASPVDIASTDGVTITIQSGTKCLFPPNSYIRVGYNNPGALLAVGTPGNPIVFKNAVENSYWGDSLGGIVLYEKALSTSRFDYCTIERAKIGIHARASTLNFTNSKVLSCDGVGIKYSDCGVPSNSSMMSTDTIIDGQSYPIEVGAEILTSAWEPPVVSACSTKSILVSTGIIKKTGTLTIRMPYVINGVVDIGDPAGTVVKVEPATTFRFGAGGALRVGKSHSGALIAEGTSSKPILFTKDLDANWGTEQGGIILCKETNSMSSFNNCVVEYATNGFYVENMVIKIENTRIGHNKNCGIYFDKHSSPYDSSTLISDSLYQNNYPIGLSSDALTNHWADPKMSDNTFPKILVKGSRIITSGNWMKHSVPYCFTGETNLGSIPEISISVSSGVVCQFDKDAFLTFGDSGSVLFNCAGTQNDTIVFERTTPKEMWGKKGSAGAGLRFFNGVRKGSSLNYCRIDGATKGVYCESKEIAINNSLITGSTSTAIQFNSEFELNDSMQFTNSTITKNNGYPIELSASNIGVLSRSLVVKDNKADTILVHGDTIKKDHTWRNIGLPFIVDKTISIGSISGATVVIDPGVSILFKTNSCIRVGDNGTGSLIAVGTSQDTIRFTTAQKNMIWGEPTLDNTGIFLYGQTLPSTQLSFCSIDQTGIGLNINAPITVNNCVIRNSTKYGILCQGEGCNSTISDINYSQNGMDFFRQK